MKALLIFVFVVGCGAFAALPVSMGLIGTVL